jgi:hypothetical protein
MARALPRTVRPDPKMEPEVGSGTRPVTKKSKESERPLRHSQRPTVRAPESASLAAYSHQPPQIHGPTLSQTPTVRELRIVPRVPSTSDFVALAALAVPSTIVSLDDVPFVACLPTDMLDAKLDHRQGFVLSLIDGKSSVQALVDACPLPEEETRRILGDLRVAGLVALRTPRLTGRAHRP